MVTETLSTLKIHKLTEEQYNRELANGNIDENAIYLTPDDDIENHNDDINSHQDIREAIARVLPIVTSSDEGKFLRVVNGTWATATVSNAEEVAF